MDPMLKISLRAAVVAALLATAACSGRPEPVAIGFGVSFGQARLGCQPDDTGLALTDLRLYLHDVQLLRSDGSAAAVRLDAAPPWQSTDVAMVDLEDGTGDCLNGTAVTHRTITGRVPPGDYRGLRFTVGVPEALNHADPLTAVAPLNRSAMHWHWRSGYKFLRAGYRQGDDGYWLHLGSARCRGTIGALEGCAEPNRVRVELAQFEPQRDRVDIDLAVLFASAAGGDGVVESCQMGPDETHCAEIQRALGLDPASGLPSAPARAFRRGPR